MEGVAFEYISVIFITVLALYFNLEKKQQYNIVSETWVKVQAEMRGKLRNFMRGNIGTPIIARVQLAREKHLVSLAVTKTSRTRLLVKN